MRAEDLAIAIANKRLELQAEIFARPPQDYQEFVKRLGVWMGLGEGLGIIEDARKREVDDD